MEKYSRNPTCRSFGRSAWAAIALLFVAQSANAAGEVAPFYVFQGRFYNEAGTSPLTGVVSLQLGVYSPDGACLLYEEYQTGIDLTASEGAFAVKLGSAVADPENKRTANDPGKSMAEIFSNKAVQLRAPGLDCVAGYTPAASDSRVLRVTYHPASGAPVTLSPDLALGATPQATVAESLQGYTPSGFLQPAAGSNLSQTTLQHLTDGTDASTLHNHDATYVKIASGAAQNVGANGIYTSGAIGVGTLASPVGSQLQVNAGTNATIGEVIRGSSAGQTADLLELQTSAGTPIFKIGPAGDVTLANATPATAVNNFSSNSLIVSGNYYTGATSAVDQWALRDELGTGGNPSSSLTLSHTGSTGLAAVVVPTGDLSVGVLAPTARLHLPASTVAAGSAPVKLEKGVLMTAAEKGAIEYDGTNLYYTDDSGVRQTLSIGSAGQWAVTGSDIYYTTGKVGIGLNNPASALDVNGDISLENGSGLKLGATGITPAGLVLSNTQNTFAGVSVTVPGNSADGIVVGGGASLLARADGTAMSLLHLAGAFGPNAGASPFYGVNVTTEINQSGTSSGPYTALRVDLTETSVRGTGNKLMDLGVGGASRFSVTNKGAVGVAESAAANAPTPAAGSDFIYADDSSHTLRASLNGGAYTDLATSSSVSAGYLPLAGGAITGPVTVSGAANSTPLDIKANTSDIELKVTSDGTTGTDPFGMGLANSNSRRATFSSLQGTYQQAMVFGDSGAGGTENIFGISSSADTGATWNPRLVVSQGGSVGIGTAAPGSFYKLDVRNGSANVYENIETSSTGSDAALRFSDGTKTFYTGILNGTMDPISGRYAISYAGDPSKVLAMDSSGYVGIGTLSPAGIFDVEGGTVATADTAGAAIKLVAQSALGPSGKSGGGVTLQPGAGAGGFGPGDVWLGNATNIVFENSANNIYSSTSGSVQAMGNTRVYNSFSADGLQAGYTLQVRNASSNSQVASIAAVSTTGAGSYTPALVFGLSTGAADYAEQMRIDGTGMQVNGAARNVASISNGSSTINFATGNLQYTTSDCGSYQLNNLKDGGTYTFAVKGTNSTTCIFTAFSDAGSTGLTVHMPTDHAATTAGKHTIYTFLVMGGDAYVAWVPGL